MYTAVIRHISTLAAIGLLVVQANASQKQEASSIAVYTNPRVIRYSPGDTMRDPYHSVAYTVRVRTPGGEWHDVYEHSVTVDWNNPQKAALAIFDFSGKVEVAVQKNNEFFSTVTIRPMARGIVPKIVDRTVFFTLTRPENLSVEFDGDSQHNLHIFAGDASINAKRPLAGPDTIIFGPGVHTPENRAEAFMPKSGQTIFIDGGAILTAPFHLENVHDVTILGHGVIVNPKGGHLIKNSARIHIEGLTTINPDHGTLACQASKDVELNGIKTFSANVWGDGINIYSCENVTLRNAFLRTSDDCFTLYGHRWDVYGDVRNVRVENSIFWADVAHAVFIGLHGDSVHPETIENAVFKNIDILDVREEQPEYQGALAISAGDSNTVRNILFDDIRIERIQEGKLFNIRVVYNDKYNTSPGRGVENVVLRHVDFTGRGMVSPSTIAGYDGGRRVRNVILDDVRIDGKKLDAASGNLDIGPFADEITFR